MIPVVQCSARGLAPVVLRVGAAGVHCSVRGLAPVVLRGGAAGVQCSASGLAPVVLRVGVLQGCNVLREGTKVMFPRPFY